MARLHASTLLALALVLLAGLLACEEPEEPTAASISANVSPFGAITTTQFDLIGGGQLRHPDGSDFDSEDIIWDWSWKVDGVDAGITDQTVPFGTTVKHQTWEVSVLADYGDGFVGPATAEKLIRNFRPQVTPVIGPGTAPARIPVGTLITVDENDFDADEDPLTFTYVWTVNGIFAGTDPTLDSSPYKSGDTIRVSVVANDGEEDGVTGIARPNRRLGPPALAALAQALVDETQATTGSESIASGSSAAARSELAGASVVGSAAEVWISIGDLNVCSIDADGTLLCTGVEEFELNESPAGAFAQVAVQADYGCAIRREDRAIACWGAPLDELGQLEAPEGAFSQIALAAGTGCGLRISGEIACWGDDSLGQASPPEGRFARLDLADTYGCAIDAYGLSTCWGELE
jgi:hypothetical protein